MPPISAIRAKTDGADAFDIKTVTTKETTTTMNILRQGRHGL